MRWAGHVACMRWEMNAKCQPKNLNELEHFGDLRVVSC